MNGETVENSTCSLYDAVYTIERQCFRIESLDAMWKVFLWLLFIVFELQFIIYNFSIKLSRLSRLNLTESVS